MTKNAARKNFKKIVDTELISEYHGIISKERDDDPAPHRVGKIVGKMAKSPSSG